MYSVLAVKYLFASIYKLINTTCTSLDMGTQHLFIQMAESVDPTLCLDISLRNDKQSYHQTVNHVGGALSQVNLFSVYLLSVRIYDPEGTLGSHIVRNQNWNILRDSA